MIKYARVTWKLKEHEKRGRQHKKNRVELHFHNFSLSNFTATSSCNFVNQPCAERSNWKAAKACSTANPLKMLDQKAVRDGITEKAAQTMLQLLLRVWDCQYQCSNKNLLWKHVLKQQLYLWPSDLSLTGLKCGFLDLDMYKVWKIQLYF